jgi:DinB family protein
MKDFLLDFQITIEDAARRLRAVPEAHAARPMEGGWSAQQILGHLIDSAANNHQRFVRAQFTDHLDFPGYEQEQWVLAQHYEAEPWPRLLELWLAYNRHLAHVVAGIRPEALSRPRARHSLDRIAWRTVPADQPATLDYLIRDYLGHLQDHLRQLYAALDR